MLFSIRLIHLQAWKAFAFTLAFLSQSLFFVELEFKNSQMADVEVETPPQPGTGTLEVRAPETKPMAPDEYQVIKKKAVTWGRAMVGLTAVILVSVIVAVVILGLISSTTNPIPDAQLRAFEWRINDGGMYNKMQNGPWQFSLDGDGVARVVNTTTGLESNPPQNSSTLTQGQGAHMILANNMIKIWTYGSNAQCLAEASPTVSAGSENVSYTLNMLPTGVLGWRSNAGDFLPFGGWRQCT